MVKSWLTAGDDRVDAHCRANEAAGWIPLDQPFPSGHQRAQGHQACRCTTLYEVDVDAAERSEVPEVPAAPTAPAVPLFTPAGTPAEAAAYSRSVLGIHGADSKGLSIEALNLSNRQLTALKERYPQVFGQIQFAGSCQTAYKHLYEKQVEEYVAKQVAQGLDAKIARPIAERLIKRRAVSGRTYAFSVPRSWAKYGLQGIALNEKYFKTAATYEALRDSVRHSAETGFHPKGCDAPESVVTHEFGHQVYEYLAARDRLDWAHELYLDALRSGLGRKDKAGDLLSIYAGKNHREFFAEAFAEYIHNSNPRPIAAAFGKRLEEEMQYP